MESRYTNRFKSLSSQTATHLKNGESAGNLTEHLAHARGSIQAQKENIWDLFNTAQELVTGIDTNQQMIGTELVKNVPKPTEAILQSPSLRLGYVQLVMRFLQAGLIHFMGEVYEAQGRIESLETFIGKLAEHDNEVELLGKMRSMDLESLDNDSNLLTPPQSSPEPELVSVTEADTKETDSTPSSRKSKKSGKK